MYRSNWPTVHAFSRFPQSQSCGNANGLRAISIDDLSEDDQTQITGMMNTKKKKMRIAYWRMLPPSLPHLRFVVVTPVTEPGTANGLFMFRRLPARESG